MKDPIKNITLRFPCQENWGKFAIVPGGRLCTSCHHIVRDFTNCTMSELNTAMKTGHTCGRFRLDQLNPAFAKAAIAAAAVSTMASCSMDIPKPKQRPAEVSYVTSGILVPSPNNLKWAVSSKHDTIASPGAALIIVKDNGDEVKVR